MMDTYKRIRAHQSQTEQPTKIPGQNQQEEEQKCEDQKPISVRHIPSPLVFEILSRVGIKTLFNCRLVCKSWADLMSTPEFAKLHLSRSPTTCLIQHFGDKPQEKVHVLFPEKHFPEKFTFLPDINVPSFPFLPTNTCNGLVCFIPRCSPRGHIYVSNPVLKEYINVPIPSYVEDLDYSFCVVGFSHITNEYKVILASYISRRCCKADIYTLGQGLWRNIAVNDPFDILYMCAYWFNWNENYNACIDGALHWITRGKSGKIICCFDFVAEQFCSVPEPSEFRRLDKDWNFKIQLSVINGNLSVCDYQKIGHIDIWVMNDYGVKESWSKHIVINNHIIRNDKRGTYKPIMVTGSGEVLLIINWRTAMTLYNPKSQDFEHEFDVPVASHTFYQTVAYVPSLISLKDVAKGENLTVIGSK